MRKSDESKYDAGLRVRKQVLGEAYVAASEKSITEFSRPLHDLLNEYVWATWARPGLPMKVRSLINIAMLTALNRPNQLKHNIRGALRTGCTKEEICEVLVQAAVYCGAPAAHDSFRVAEQALAEAEEGPKTPSK